ncbi:hypothetical protein GCM10009715_34410 [Paeniglutamicibacter psychrophenolicus]
MHASATGLAFLGASTVEFVPDVMDGPLGKVGEQTATAPGSMWKLVREARECGYAINEEGPSSGITSLGATIVNSAGSPVGCVSISGPSSRILPAKYEEYGTAMVRTAGEISTLLRGRR